jgi:hypothetical protein
MYVFYLVGTTYVYKDVKSDEEFIVISKEPTLIQLSVDINELIPIKFTESKFDWESPDYKKEGLYDFGVRLTFPSPKIDFSILSVEMRVFREGQAKELIYSHVSSLYSYDEEVLINNGQLMSFEGLESYGLNRVSAYPNGYEAFRWQYRTNDKSKKLTVKAKIELDLKDSVTKVIEIEGSFNKIISVL